MKRSIVAALVISTGLFAQAASAEDNVLIPSKLELDEQQTSDLKDLLSKHATKVVTKCVAQHPRPEFFTSLRLNYDLRKSGELRGGYIAGGAIDSSMYVKSDEERDKLKSEGALARIVVRHDRDLDRCLKKATRTLETQFDRISAKIDVTYNIKWDGKKPKVEASAFEVKKG